VQVLFNLISRLNFVNHVNIGLTMFPLIKLFLFIMTWVHLVSQLNLLLSDLFFKNRSNILIFKSFEGLRTIFISWSRIMFSSLLWLFVRLEFVNVIVLFTYVFVSWSWHFLYILGYSISFLSYKAKNINKITLNS
jgi:hypothetical protein